jgi:type VI secretion system protein ImpJ
MPPSLSLTAAGLQQMLDSLLGKLNVKIEALYNRHRQPTRHAIEVHSGDIASFWMLNTISTAGAALMHCARYRQHHPEALFDRLMTLAGGLMTFSTRYALADLPAYRHDDAGPAFAQLDALIRDLVDTVISSKYFNIALTQEEQKNTHYHGQLEATRVDRQTALCLAVNADMPALELVSVVPLRFKVGSPDDIERIIGLALPGIELVHMAQVPSEVPVRPNTYYFSVESKGTLYDNMLKAQAIAIYVPTGIKGLRLELFGITP